MPARKKHLGKNKSKSKKPASLFYFQTSKTLFLFITIIVVVTSRSRWDDLLLASLGSGLGDLASTTGGLLNSLCKDALVYV